MHEWMYSENQCRPEETQVLHVLKNNTAGIIFLIEVSEQTIKIQDNLNQESSLTTYLRVGIVDYTSQHESSPLKEKLEETNRNYVGLPTCNLGVKTRQHLVMGVVQIDNSRPTYSCSPIGYYPKDLCCLDVLENKINTCDFEHYSIILYGTGVCDALESVKCVIPFEKLKLKQKELMLKELIDISCNPDLFKQTFGITDDYILENAFWACSLAFSNSQIDFDTKRIIHFASNDNPHADQPGLQQMTRTKAKYLKENDIHVQLLTKESAFNYDLFYQEFLDIVNAEYLKLLPCFQTLDTVELLREKIIRVLERNRFMHKLLWEFGNYNLAVKIYNLKSKNYDPNDPNLCDPIPFHDPGKFESSYHFEFEFFKNDPCLRPDGELIVEENKLYVLKENRFNYVFPTYLNSWVNFVEKRGMKFLGYRDDSCIDNYLDSQYKEYDFLYQDEEDPMKGNNRLFKTLVYDCLNQKKVMVCTIGHGLGRRSGVVHLKPQIEILDEGTEIRVCPFGFHMIYIFFEGSVEEMNELSSNISSSSYFSFRHEYSSFGLSLSIPEKCKVFDLKNLLENKKLKKRREWLSNVKMINRKYIKLGITNRLAMIVRKLANTGKAESLSVSECRFYLSQFNDLNIKKKKLRQKKIRELVYEHTPINPDRWYTSRLLSELLDPS